MTNKQIKTNIIAIALIISVALSLLAIGYNIGRMSKHEPTTTYTMSGVWTPDGNTIITEDGNEWHYLCTEDGYMPRCTVTFDNNNTPYDKTDDTIIDVTVRG